MTYYIVMTRKAVVSGSPRVWLAGPYRSRSKAREYLAPAKTLARNQDPTAKSNTFEISQDRPGEDEPVRFTQDKLDMVKERLESTNCEDLVMA